MSRVILMTSVIVRSYVHRSDGTMVKCKKDRKSGRVFVYEDFGKYVGINTSFSAQFFLAVVLPLNPS